MKTTQKKILPLEPRIGVRGWKPSILIELVYCCNKELHFQNFYGPLVTGWRAIVWTPLSQILPSACSCHVLQTNSSTVLYLEMVSLWLERAIPLTLWKANFLNSLLYIVCASPCLCCNTIQSIIYTSPSSKSEIFC